MTPRQNRATGGFPSRAAARHPQVRTLLRDEGETRGWAARLALRARGGATICLQGPLGSGKTTFVRGFMEGLGGGRQVMSPTFALSREYRAGGRRVIHLDLFRVRPADMRNLGLEEPFNDPGTICLVEWPRAARRLLPEDRLEISLSHRSNRRELMARALGPRSERLIRALQSRS